jgi:hypothetical protein
MFIYERATKWLYMWLLCIQAHHIPGIIKALSSIWKLARIIHRWKWWSRSRERTKREERFTGRKLKKHHVSEKQKMPTMFNNVQYSYRSTDIYTYWDQIKWWHAVLKITREKQVREKHSQRIITTDTNLFS